MNFFLFAVEHYYLQAESSNLQPSLILWLPAVQMSSLNTASSATKHGGTGIFQGLTLGVSGSAATWASVTLRGFCMAQNFYSWVLHVAYGLEFSSETGDWRKYWKSQQEMQTSLNYRFFSLHL